MQRNKPWYSVRPRVVNPPPIDALHRTWVIDQLINGQGCPEIASCGVPGRDGENCRQLAGKPRASVPQQPAGSSASLQQQGGSAAFKPAAASAAGMQQQGQTPSSSMMQPAAGAPAYESFIAKSDAGSGSSMQPAAGAPAYESYFAGGGAPMTGGQAVPGAGSAASGAVSGTVGLRPPILQPDGSAPYVYEFSPEALRSYALWWRKRWGAPMSCSGYKREQKDWAQFMSCAGYAQDGPADALSQPCQQSQAVSDYARNYARQRRAADASVADRNLIRQPGQALQNYLQAVEICMRAGRSWKQCAQQGDLVQLRQQALQQGVSPNALSASLGFLGKPMEPEALEHGVRAACDMHTRGSVDCSQVARSVTNEALALSPILLSLSGQALQNRLEQQTMQMGEYQFVTDPQALTSSAAAVMRRLYKDALASLQAAWGKTRNRIGLPPKSIDLATPLMQYLLANGWSTVVSNPWTKGQTRIWLLGTPADPMRIDPATASEKSWPWAAAYQNWQGRGTSRPGLFALYTLLRVEPLQDAVRQGLRDIAVMLIDEQMRSATA